VKMQWAKQTGKYDNGENYYIGRIKVGSACYNQMRSKTDEYNEYKSNVLLPGIKLRKDVFTTLEEAKKAVEKAVDYWLGLLESEKI